MPFDSLEESLREEGKYEEKKPTLRELRYYDAAHSQAQARSLVSGMMAPALIPATLFLHPPFLVFLIALQVLFIVGYAFFTVQLFYYWQKRKESIYAVNDLLHHYEKPLLSRMIDDFLDR